MSISQTNSKHLKHTTRKSRDVKNAAKNVSFSNYNNLMKTLRLTTESPLEYPIMKNIHRPSSHLDTVRRSFDVNDLMELQLPVSQSRRNLEILQEQAIMRKIFEIRKYSESQPQVLEVTQATALESSKLLRAVNCLYPFTSLQPEWVDSIKEKLRGKHMSFPSITSSVLDEVKCIFDKDISTLNLVCDSDGCGRESQYSIGKTSRYWLFLDKCKKIEKSLYLLHPLQRKIFMTAVDCLPEALADFTRYQSLGVLDLSTLEDYMYADLKQAENLVSLTFYMQVVDLLTDESHGLLGVPHKERAQFLKCATNIVQSQVEGFLYRSIEHLLWLTEDAQRMPKINLNLFCDDHKLHLVPCSSEFCNLFHEFLDKISEMGHKLAPLETWVDGLLIPPGNIKVHINEPYMFKAHQILRKNLENVLVDLRNYLENMNWQHHRVYSGTKMSILQSVLEHEHTFEELVHERTEFQKYVDGLDELVVNEFFGIGRVCQYDLIKSLYQRSAEYSDFLMKKIFQIHAAENRLICQCFEELKAKALKEPESTEELMDMGAFMLGASASIVQALEDRIHKQLCDMSIIIHLAQVPQEFIQLMALAVNWLSFIKPVFELNTAQYEQQKFEFEERLQKRTETLSKDLEDLGPKLVVLNNMDDIARVSEYNQEIGKFLSILDRLDKDVEWINHEEFLFKFPVSTYPELDELHNFLNPFAKLICQITSWQWRLRVWMNGSFQDLEASTVESITDQFYKEFLETQKTYKAKIKQQITDNVSRRFKGNVDDPDPNNIPVPIKICNKTIEQIKEFRTHVPLVRILCNKALQERHWDEMSAICSFDITPDYGTTLKHVLELGLAPYLDQFEIISVGACKELQLNENLLSMMEEWAGMTFTISSWKDTSDMILTEVDDIQALVDDHLIKTIAMRGSAFVKPFETDVNAWYKKLDRVNKTIEEWGNVQTQWLYLLPIFSCRISVEMLTESGLFSKINREYRQAMNKISKDPRALITAGAPGLYELFHSQNILFEKINNGVNILLDKKRLFFPRFFFLSNDEMLEILSQTNPQLVEPHLRKCFEGITTLYFNDKLEIEAMISSEGEVVPFTKFVHTESCGVEDWLLKVEQEMLATLQEEVSRAFRENRSAKRTVWIQSWPGQVVLCVSAMFWTADVHQCLSSSEKNAPSDFHQELIQQLNDTVNLVRSKLPRLTRATLGALIVMDVHAKDIMEALVRDNIRSDLDFSWLAQLRYYWTDHCLVRMVNASISYAYEYLGNTPRLVITPLTDRCYRTLIGAYWLHLNGAPEGPAGTGKTETTKDLAKALAVQCIVFNCSDGLDYKAMGKFFKGLASSGAWACFDEFNRIELEVLSVVAQQIFCIMRAVQSGVEKFMFEGTVLKLNPTCYVCITMNPGYAGRSELPDNLKVLFRTVAMMVPDYALIGEISLYSFGFHHARSLAIKIVTTYRLCSEQLSVQSHYDYGMRAVKTVLTSAGHLKLTYPDRDEQLLLLRAIIDVNKSKLLDQDLPLFDGIIQDMFPGIVPMPLDHSSLIVAIDDVCAIRNIQCVEYFQKKVLETYDMMLVRHGFMLVGEPYGGKTSILSVLAEALCKIGEETEVKKVNPKSVTLDQLYGQFDPISLEWTDGILSSMYRDFARNPSATLKWLILDGPVDAVWIENLNTVLDDNKKLCLNSGEVLVMSSKMSLIFEVADLKQASPATVSRCGMIYVEPKALGWEVLATSWIAENGPIWIMENTSFICDLIAWVIPPSLNFIRKNCVSVTNTNDSARVVAMLQIVKMLMVDACQTMPLYVSVWVQAAMLYGGVWGMGGSLNLNSRPLFSDFYLELWRGNIENCPIPESLGRADVTLPTEGTLYDYCYNFKGKGNWRQCSDILKQEKVDEPLNLAQMLVPTTDTVKYTTLVQLHINHNIPLLLVGSTGTGKSFMMQNILTSKVDQETILPAFVTFTVSSSANETQKLIISKLIKRKRHHFGPPKGQRCVLMIDDVNMPAKEEYGAQPAVELLRQFIDSGNWYDFKTCAPIYLQDVLIIAAMGLPGGNRQEISTRLLRHFNVFAINDASEESMNRIFSAVLFASLKRNGFASDAMAAVGSIVNATMDVYLSTLSELRPTPTKSHYVFNLRDFARVIYGCALLKKESVDSRKIFAKLWVHETLRVFYDRLIDACDRSWMYEKIKVCVKEHMKENFDHVFDNLKLEDGVCTENALRDLMFGSYLDPDALEDDRKYEEVATIDQLLEVATAVMSEYNSTHNAKLDLVLFRYALEHLSRICRILALPGGSGLLVGVSGSGRQSLSKLATAMMGYNFFQPEITAGYSQKEWRKDLKKVLKEAGALAKSTTFLFSDGQVKSESFLYDIDALLNLGEIPELFTIDEKQEILELVRLSAQGGNRNLDISPLAVFNFFVARCKQRLHLLLCFSPIGSSFRNRLRIFSSLVNCCTIDWFFDWPVEALEIVANIFMSGVNLSDIVKSSVVTAAKYFHITAKSLSNEFYTVTNRITYITSAAFLELITSFTKLTNKTQEETLANKLRYVVGLEKLEFAANQVTDMSKELSLLKPKLQVAKALTIEMMQNIEVEKKKVESAAALVKEDEKVANKQAAASMELKAECEADLAQAIPILEEAIAALNTLKPTDITLVKSMKNPPDAIKLVMAAVCVMKDVKPDRLPDPATGKKVLDYWGPSKRILGDMAFLQQLKEYDKDNIAPEIMIKIRKEYIPHKDFKPHVVAKASSAAEGLCKWIIAMDLYDAVAKEVAPKKAKLEVAEREYAATMVLLNQKRAEVNKLEEELGELLHKLNETQEKKQKLEDDVTLCSNKLWRAEKLIDGLGGEKSRWEAAASQLQANYDSIAGDILLSCGVISYLSPFTLSYRNSKINDWHNKCIELNIPCSTTYSFAAVLGSEVKIQSWHIFGLPRDEFSTSNAIILDASNKWPLLIDPQGQANKWIKTMETGNGLEVAKIADPNCMKTMINCITYGKPILLENVLEHVDAALNPILNRNIFEKHGKYFISLKDDVIEYNLKFKLYLTSNLRNPHYEPDICNKVRVINFALTMEGLEDQLLGIVVAKERPDLQTKRQDLIVRGAKNKQELLEAEEMILQTLSNTKGNILEDETAIEILDSSKKLSQDIIIEQESAKKTSEVIESFRSHYRSFASHSAVLYYSISDLVNVDPMYQYSLTWFIKLFLSSIDSANNSNVFGKRVQFLRERFTYDLYSNVCRSLFEKDKVLFSFVLSSKILEAEGQITHAELMFLLTGGSGLQAPTPNPASEWLKDKSWEQLCELSAFPVYDGLVGHVIAKPLVWRKFYDLKNPTLQDIPETWRIKLSEFQKLIIIRVFRPDKLIPNISIFVRSVMGDKFTKPPSFHIEESYNESNCFCPLVFILSPGSDPMGALTSFAEKKGALSKFESISLGQGQGPLAASLIAKAQKDGSWVCLQNCHLAASWMPTLEKIWEAFDLNNTALTFRLWLTSYPSDAFPSLVLQNSVKMTNENPTGLQPNINRSFTSYPVNEISFFEGCPGKNNNFGKLLYGLTFFHAVVQERKKFGPIGWNIPYSFDESDFHISVRQLQTFIQDSPSIPYEAVNYLVGECNYGGRVTDEWDRRTLVTILLDFINSNVINSLNYKFAPGPSFGLPFRTSYQDYLNHITRLPTEPSPEVFGLHSNAGITQGIQSTKALFESFLLIEGSTHHITYAPDNVLYISQKILDRLPDNFNIESVLLKYPVSYSESMNALLSQEMERFNNLLNSMRKSLNDLNSAVSGYMVMTAELDNLLLSLQMNQIPVVWRKFSYNTLKSLGSYLTDLFERIVFFQNWQDYGKPSKFWISGFFSTHGFLTGIMQNFARKYSIPIDLLTFDFSVLKVDLETPPENGAYVYGLFLDGARWDRNLGHLAEQHSTVLFDPMPLIWLRSIRKADLKENNRYRCPLYKTSERRGTLSTTGISTNFVIPFLLETDKPVQHWIKRGVALLCQLNEC